MKLSEYQLAAYKTAAYPEELKIVYPSMGLAGEIGEVCNKAKKIHRDDGGVLTDARKAQIRKEVGGALWYVAALATDLNLRLHDEWAIPTKQFMDINKCCLRLAYHAGKIAGLTDGHVEGDGIIYLTHLSAIVRICAMLLWHLGTDVETVAQENIDILASRVERGTLHGDGDNR